MNGCYFAKCAFIAELVSGELELRDMHALIGLIRGLLDGASHSESIMCNEYIT